MIPDPARRLETCGAVIFIAYTVPPEAEANGYSDWLKRVDMPFFNAIPGTLHYANWRLSGIERGAAPVWDYFDFQGLEAEDDLERVWFNPDLDGFRTEWLRLWGYGKGEAPPVLRHSYLMRPVWRAPDIVTGDSLTLSGGVGAPPEDASQDLVFAVEGVLHKHFGGREEGKAWRTPAAEMNPLGLDWLSVSQSGAAPPEAATLVARARLIAAPDR